MNATLRPIFIMGFGLLTLFFAGLLNAQELTGPVYDHENDPLEALWRLDPVGVAEALGVEESCFDRCSSCKNCQSPPWEANCHCPFTECVENCSKHGHNHPICCVGCCETNPDITARNAQAAANAAKMGVPIDWKPPSPEVGEAVAEFLGLGKSCGARCADCSSNSCQGTSQFCNFFSCTLNCSAGHHPVCCYGCTGDNCQRPDE